MATAPQDDAPKTRTQDPTYDVFTAMDHDDCWELIAQGVKAPSRKAAIVEAVKDNAENTQYGDFATVRSGEFRPITRRRKVEPTDVWE